MPNGLQITGAPEQRWRLTARCQLFKQPVINFHCNYRLPQFSLFIQCQITISFLEQNPIPEQMLH